MDGIAVQVIEEAVATVEIVDDNPVTVEIVEQGTVAIIELGVPANASYVDAQISALIGTAANPRRTLGGLSDAIDTKADASSLATVATSGAYADLSGTPTIPTNNNQLTNGAGYEVAANKGQPNGYAGLDSGGLVALASMQVRRAQFLKALSATVANGVKTLIDSIPADADDATNIAFNHEPFVMPGGVLASFVQTAFSFSNAQMTSLFALAATQPN